MNDARKPSRASRRPKPARRVGSARGTETRTVFGRRAKFPNNPLSRVLRAVERTLGFGNPMLFLGVALVVASGIAALFAGGYIHRASAAADRMAGAIASDAGFGISTIHLSGNRNVVPDAVYGALGFSVGQSIFEPDIHKARENLRRLEWVADAEVTRRYPDAVYVRLIEKIPFAIWSNGKEVYVVDRSGNLITRADQSHFPHLPLFVGEQPFGASDLVEAVALHRAISSRVKAMQRVAERRWNLILDDGVVVKLPETGWDKQLAVLERLMVEKGVLEFDIREIDLRTHGHYTFVLRHQEPPQHKVSRGDAA